MVLPCFLVIWHFTKKPFLPQGLTFPPLKIDFFIWATCTLVPLYLCVGCLMCQFFSWVTIIYLFFMVPFRPPLCGSIIKSPFFRVSKMSHPCIYGVSSKSLWLQLQCSIHCSLHLSHYVHIWPPALPLHLFWTPIRVIDHPLRNWVIHYQINHLYHALTREVISLPLILFPSIIILGFSPSITLLWFLVP